MRIDKDPQSFSAETLLIKEFLKSDGDLYYSLPGSEFDDFTAPQIRAANDARRILLLDCIENRVDDQESLSLETGELRFLINSILNLTERTNFYGKTKVILSKSNRVSYIREKIWRFVFCNIHSQLDNAYTMREQYPPSFEAYDLELVAEEITQMEMHLDSLVCRALET